MQIIPLEMQKDINRKIEELKAECGEWGKERRYKYLLETCLRYDIEIEMLEAMYIPGVWNKNTVILAIIKKWEKLQKPLLQEMDYMLRPRDNQITPEMIQRAREYPITNLIEFSKGKARCISGTHADNNPSMSYKPNFVKCFSCGYKADSIAVAMQIKNLSFKEVVKWLNL